MADHAEEQEMEAEALAAIFDTHFQVVATEPQPEWAVEIYPETGDPSELDDLNHVACRLIAKLPADYPDESLPTLSVEIVKGLADEHRQLLLGLAEEEATANEGVPSIFAIAERLREWLAENNVTGLDDISMHAQMMRKQQEEAKQKAQAATAFEGQKQQEALTAAEQEELAVRKRRAEGTPCNKENFLVWKAQFEAEMAQTAQEEEEAAQQAAGKKKTSATATAAADSKAERITGFDHFSGKATNLEALEAAAEQAENEEAEEEELEDVNEELFDDDVDLDDLDFDDDDDDEEDLDI